MPVRHVEKPSFEAGVDNDEEERPATPPAVTTPDNPHLVLSQQLSAVTSEEVGRYTAVFSRSMFIYLRKEHLHTSSKQAYV